MSLITKEQFAIHGIRLGHDKRTLNDFDTKTLRIYPKSTAGVELWEWRVTRTPMSTPHRIKFIDGLVFHISGSELSFGNLLFTRETEQAELLSQIPLQRDPDLTRGYGWLQTPDFRLSIRMTPRFKVYLLTDMVLGDR